ncbi:MAG: zinc ribbon domain-containing protein [Anaerolineales bacterium]
MKSVWKWILLGIAVFVVAFLIALPLWAGIPMASGRLIGGYGMMRGGMMGWGLGGFGWIGMLFRLAVPLFVIGGVAALVYHLAKRPSAPPPAATVPCENCGKPLDPGWLACPYCGKKKK